MNHQTLEEWLFFSKDEADDMLTTDQVAQVVEHIRACSSCGELVNAWHQVEGKLQNAPLLSPSLGFSTRWQNRLQMERQKRYEKQTLRVLVIGVITIIALLAFLVFVLLPWFLDPEFLIWAGIYRIASVAVNLEVIINLLSKLFQSVNITNPLFPWWLLTVGLSCELGVLWIVSYQLLTKPWRIVR